MTPKRPLAERFALKINFDGPVMPGMDSPCHMWTASTGSDGYGQILVDGSLRRAHRIAYELATGVDPLGRLEVGQRCGNRLCCNPGHLRLVTHKQNAQSRRGIPRNNKSGVRGVYWNKNARRWRGHIQHNGELIHVGYFRTITEAEAAVIAKHNELISA